MVTKKKGLYLGLLLSLLGIGSVIQAYEVIIKNETKHRVKFFITYSDIIGYYLVELKGRETLYLSRSRSIKKVRASLTTVSGRYVQIMPKTLPKSSRKNDIKFTVYEPEEDQFSIKIQ